MNEPVFSVTEPMSLPFARLHRFHVPRTFSDPGIISKVGKAGNAESNLLKHEMAMWGRAPVITGRAPEPAA